MSRLLLIILTVYITSCFHRDYSSDSFISPTGLLKISATVNRTDESNNNYAEVIINIVNNETGKNINNLNTKAGDFSKWSIGRKIEGDTIVFQSSDIGNKAWAIKGNVIEAIAMDDKLTQRADYITLKKYK